MSRLPDLWRIVAGLLGLTAVMIGAAAAHALHDTQAISAVERASNYQLAHAIVLMVACLIPGRAAQLSRWCFVAGILLFSGSIYAKYLLDLAGATKFAPTGGILLMLGWLSLAFSSQANAK
ncbi:MAG: DUF423 domain-containing protein [Sheuella sp.]|nr:DUF423 domain-containing protein [Sheuella sp.]